MKTMLHLAFGFLLFTSSALGADPTGSWKSTIRFHENQLDNTLNLRLDSEGPTLTGGFVEGQSNRETPITSASFKRGELNFSVVLNAGGEKLSVRFTGRLAGDTITGQTTVDFGDRTQSTEWVATRQN